MLCLGCFPLVLSSFPPLPHSSFPALASSSPRSPCSSFLQTSRWNAGASLPPQALLVSSEQVARAKPLCRTR
eukprot:341446-Rhodomonas_salina.1